MLTVPAGERKSQPRDLFFSDTPAIVTRGEPVPVTPLPINGTTPLICAMLKLYWQKPSALELVLMLMAAPVPSLIPSGLVQAANAPLESRDNAAATTSFLNICFVS